MFSSAPTGTYNIAKLQQVEILMAAPGKILLLSDFFKFSEHITETRPLKNVAREKWGTH